MDKEFVDYKTALALKELGFDEPCMASRDMNNDEGLIQIPLKQQAFRWFREKYRLWAEIIWMNTDFEGFTKGANARIKSQSMTEFSHTFDTYEEAEQACLDKLIEICKNK